MQFLDAVHQLLEQLPHAFEFSDALLLWLSEAVYAGQFVNFLFNCERLRLPHRTKGADAWAYVMANQTLFLNPYYTPVATSVLKFDPHPRSITLWRGLWLSRIRLPPDTKVLLVRVVYVFIL